MKLPWQKLVELVHKVRARKTPSWALPTCPHCRISMADKGQTYKCPSCLLEFVKEPSGKRGPLLNEGDHHGQL